MNRYTLIISILLLSGALSAQKQITLEECQEMAKANYPLIKQYNLISQTEQYTLSNIGKAYLPQFHVNGQATYQSEVTRLPVDFGALGLPVDIKPMSKDQYKATVDVNQVIWDGGKTDAQRKTAEANAETEKHQVEVTLYQIKEKVNQLYFGILAIDEQLKLLNILEEDLQANRAVMQSMFENGTIAQSDVDRIDVELLHIGQNRTEQEALKASFMHMLSAYIHQNIGGNVVLDRPQNSSILTNTINRPELAYYNSVRSSLDSQKAAITAKNRPQLGLFAQGGYGRPGLNMLEDKFKLFAIGGIKLTWNFGNLYTKKNEQKQIELNKNSIDVQEEIFLFNIDLQLTRQQSETQMLKKQMEKDNEIIDLLKRVKTASESKYKNGVYQVNDLLKDINAENQARQKKVLREIQYLQSIYNQKQIQGN